MIKIEAISGAGGVGKSTLLLALAAHWTKDGAKVAVIDLDPSKQLTDVYRKKPCDYDLVNHLNVKGYDLLLIDNAPATREPTHNPDIVLYPMLPHSKSLDALKRTSTVLHNKKVVYVCNRCDFRLTRHKENDARIRLEYNSITIKSKSFYEAIMEDGGNFLDYEKNNAYYKVKNEIALLAQRIERFF